MSELESVDPIVSQIAFSGVVRIDPGDEAVTKAFGLSDRAHAIPNTPDTVFALASRHEGFHGPHGDERR